MITQTISRAVQRSRPAAASAAAASRRDSQEHKRDLYRRSSDQRVSQEFVDEFVKKLATKDFRRVSVGTVPTPTFFGSESVLFEDRATPRKPEQLAPMPFGRIHPNAPLKVVWDLWMCFCIIYSVTVVPFRICFGVDADGDAAVWEMLLDVCFGIDIILTFFVAIPHYDGTYTVDLRQLAITYSRSWLLLDVISTLPFAAIAAAAAGGEPSAGVAGLKVLRILRIVRLVKLVRLFKMSKFISSLTFITEASNLNPAIFSLAKFFCALLLLAHLIACLFFFIGSNDVEDPGSWIVVQGLLDASLFEQYITALYWTITTMATVGYGDIVGGTQGQRIFSVFVQLSGVSAFGFVVGNVTSILESMDLSAAVYAERMQEVQEYLQHRKLPDRLARRIQRYYEYYLHKKSNFDESTILAELSTNLRNQVVRQANADTIRKIALFHNNSELVTVIVPLLKPMFLTAGELLCTQNHVGQEMYFIYKGIVEGTVSDVLPDVQVPVAMFTNGYYCGDVAILLNQRRPMSLKAVVNCDMFSLTQVQLLDALTPFAATAAQMEQHAKRSLLAISAATHSMFHAARRQMLECVALKHLPHPDLERPVLSEMLTEEHVLVNEVLVPAATLPRRLWSADSQRIFEVLSADLVVGDGRGNSWSNNSSSRFVTQLFAPRHSIMARNTLAQRHPRNNGESSKTPSPVGTVAPEPAAQAFEKSADAIFTGYFSGDVAVLQPQDSLQLEEQQSKLDASDGTFDAPLVMPAPAPAPVIHTPQGPVEPELGRSTSKGAEVLAAAAAAFSSIHVIQPQVLGYAPGDVLELGRFFGRMDSALTSSSDAPWSIIAPDSFGKTLWDAFVTCLIIYSAVTVPVNLAFDINDSTLGAIDNAVDILFGIDICLSFRTGFVRSADDGLVVKSRQIAIRYLKGWFFIDLVSTFPFDPILGEDGASLVGLRLIRILRLVRIAKMLRLLRLSDMYSKLERSAGEARSFLRAFKILFQLTFMAHLTACAWYAVSFIDESDAWWTHVRFLDKNQADLYVTSIYYAFTTLTTVGYGDVLPSTPAEKIFAIFLMLAGASTFGYIVGSMASLVGRFNGADARVSEKMDQIEAYMRDRRLTKDLRHKVRQYYQFYLERKTAFNESHILEELCDSLRTEVLLHLNKDIIASIPFFKGLAAQTHDDGFLAYMISILNPMFAAPGDFLFKEGEVGQEMFFLVKGCVQVLSGVDTRDVTELAILKEGSFFGEIAVLIDSRRSASVRALTFCNLFTLHRDDLNSMIIHYPLLAGLMREAILKKMEELVQTGHDQAASVEMRDSLRKELRRLTLVNKMVKKLKKAVSARQMVRAKADLLETPERLDGDRESEAYDDASQAPQAPPSPTYSAADGESGAEYVYGAASTDPTFAAEADLNAAVANVIANAQSDKSIDTIEEHREHQQHAP